MNQEIETYKNSLIDKACQSKSIIRVSFCDYKDDTDLVYEGQIDRGDAGQIAENVIQKIEEFIVNKKLKKLSQQRLFA
ncbi:MAG: hypothetical protein PHX84_00580 [Candidatus Shapirobacteria bacterium]|nr:hypothetical protein [Candidatus Shapirobacteria bacterium]